jgi:spore coat protein H
LKPIRFNSSIQFCKPLLWIVLLYWLVNPAIAVAQLELEFRENTKPDAINTFAFNLDPKKLKQIHLAKGKKISANVDTVRINQKKVPADYMRIRGSSSSHYYRKSYNIKLRKNARFFNHKKFELKKLYAVSLNMDRNYIRNRIAYAVLTSLDITVPPHAYVNFVGNNVSEGIYMAFYPPADFAVKELKSPFVIRRGYESSIKKTYDKNIAAEEVKSLKLQFTSIYKKILPKYAGEELYTRLNEIINLEQYFTWMAFNHLFQNGDYTDEVYFVWNKETSKFELIPWDFDDLFQNTPHEENPILKSRPFVFSAEDSLDAAIAADSFLYEKYLQAYRAFLKRFTKEELKKVLEEVYTEVSPYFADSAIISQSQYDKYGLTDLANLQRDMNSIFMNLSIRINFVQNGLSKPTP